MKKYDGTLTASYLMLEKGGKVLLIRRYRTGWHDGDFTLPAGHIKPAESALKTAVREAKEEVGVSVKPADLSFVHVAHRNRTPDNNEYIDFYFKTSHWTGKLRLGSSCDKLLWAPLTKLPPNTIPVVKTILESISRGQSFSAYGW